MFFSTGRGAIKGWRAKEANRKGGALHGSAPSLPGLDPARACPSQREAAGRRRRRVPLSPVTVVTT
jgi:hypothetical protein